MVGIIVHGDNHFIVRGSKPDARTARALVRHWSIIRIGAGTPEHLSPWRISTKEFREDLTWAWIVPGECEPTAAVRQLLDELAARGVPLEIAR
ncbi:MAG: hypothetical protein JNK87_20535 [Bryobacterales bacterium]|nr:hypothetical protein [Bryobacterales bacterium]